MDTDSVYPMLLAKVPDANEPQNTEQGITIVEGFERKTKSLHSKGPFSAEI